MAEATQGWHDELLAVLPRVRRVALALTRAPSDADDLLQSTVEKALTNRHQFEPGTALDRWMITICRNLWLSEYRSKARRGPHQAFDETAIPPENDPEWNMERRLALQDTMAALDRITEDQRVIIMLSAVEHLSYKEIADTLQIPIGTVMSRLARARRALSDQLSKGHGGPRKDHADHG